MVSLTDYYSCIGTEDCVPASFRFMEDGENYNQVTSIRPRKCLLESSDHATPAVFSILYGFTTFHVLGFVIIFIYLSNIFAC